MLKNFKPYGFIILFFLLLSAVVFRVGFGKDVVFAGSDANAGTLSRLKGDLPEALIGTYTSAPLFGSTIKLSLSVRNLIIWLLPVEITSDVIYPFWLILSSLAMIGYLRLWNCGYLYAVFGALGAFWTGSITLASAGHINKPAVAAFFVIALYLFEKYLRTESKRRSFGYALLFGGAVGFMLLEQQDVGLYATVFLGPYMLLRLIQVAGKTWQTWARCLIPAGITALLICAGPALEAYSANVADVAGDQQQSPEQKWDFVTQWSFPPAEWPDLIAPGYTGWSTGNPKGPYWGVMGQSAEWPSTGKGFQNFRLDSLYIGVLPVMAAFLAWLTACRSLTRKDEKTVVIFFWAVAALTALMLSMGKFSPLYRVFYNLPLVNNIRAPVKFMHNLQIIVGILSAFGLHGLMAGLRKNEKFTLLPWLAGAAGMFGIFMLAMAVSPGDSQRFANWGQYSTIIIATLRRAWMHSGLMMLFLAACTLLLLLKKQWMPRLMTGIPVLFIAALAFDSLYLTSKYFHAENISGLRKGNPVFDYVKEHQGDGRLFLFSQDGVYNRWLASDFSYHKIKAYNIWQMPRMSADYRQYLGTLGGNWKRMIDLASVTHAMAPAGIWDQIQKSPVAQQDFEKVMFYRFLIADQEVNVQKIQQATQPSDQVLLKVKSSLPRLGLFTDWELVNSKSAGARLTARDFNPKTKVLISAATPPPQTSFPTPGAVRPLEEIHITPSIITAKSTSERDGVVLFTQHFESGWRVTVDDEPAQLLRCNDVSMGVFMPRGNHRVSFIPPRRSGSPLSQITGILMALSGLLFLPQKRT